MGEDEGGQILKFRYGAHLFLITLALVVGLVAPGRGSSGGGLVASFGVDRPGYLRAPPLDISPTPVKVEEVAPLAILEEAEAPLASGAVVTSRATPTSRGEVMAEPAPPSTVGERVVAIALGYLGYPYVWRGASPGGFDCSGFTQYVYGQVGVALPRDVPGQWGVGVVVGRDSLEPGDLVFFTNTFQAGLSHVGIYLGGGQFVSAASEERGVVVDELSSPFWAARYYGARRP